MKRVKEELMAQHSEHERKEQIYQQRIQQLEFELNEMKARRENMDRLNQKMVNVLDSSTERGYDSKVLQQFDLMMERENERITSIEKELLESKCRLGGSRGEQTSEHDVIKTHQLFKLESSVKKANHSDSFKNISINPLQEQLAGE